MPITDYHDLAVWKTGKEISLEIYRLTGRFPPNEKFGLVSQMRRAAISIPSNISEGFFRFSRKDFQRFLLMALGSCGELDTQLEISRELGLISLKDFLSIKGKVQHKVGMLRKFINKNKSFLSQ